MRPGVLQVWDESSGRGWMVGWLAGWEVGCWLAEQNGGRVDQLRRLGSLIRA